MSNDLEQFNAHQQDVRNRALSLVKIILFLAGGTLSISIGVFVKDTAPELSDSSQLILKWAWLSLFASIFFLLTSLVAIVARDYRNGEVWRASLKGSENPKEIHRVWVEVSIWALAICGYLAFLTGMFGIARVAILVSSNT